MKVECPADGKTYFYVDKVLPFGSSISCKIFQEFSDSIAFLVQYRTNKILINYLDYYLFIQYLKQQCNDQVCEFLTVCKLINFPVSMEKTFWATHILTFLGLLINTISQTVSIPIEKIEKGKELLLRLLPKQKITVAQLEELTGFLNFLCKAVVPGRVFTRRFYMEFSTVMKPHYHIRNTKEMKEDMKMWLDFLNHPSVYARPFLDFSSVITADEINMYSDASGKIGFGAFAIIHGLQGFGMWISSSQKS